MDFYLIRHGNMAGDPHEEFTPPVREGCLSEKGVAQAAQCTEALSGIRFDRIFASSLGRAVQTAQGTSDRLNCDIEVIPWIKEWIPADQLTDSEATRYEVMQKRSAELRPEQSWKTPAGEGAFEMAHRIIPPFLNLMDSLGVEAGHGGYLLKNPDDVRKIAFFAHGGSLSVLLNFLLGLPTQPFAPVSFAETGVAVVRLVRRVDVWYPTLLIAPPGLLPE